MDTDRMREMFWTFQQCLIVALLFAVLGAFAYVRYMEALGRFDSIGLWYSVLVTVCIAAPISVVLAALGTLAVHLRSV